MNTYIALFRGINVGGGHLLPMKDLKLMLEHNGCVDVQTDLRSGNVILRSNDQVLECQNVHAVFMHAKASRRSTQRNNYRIPGAVASVVR